MQINIRSESLKTYEGGPSSPIPPFKQLQRLVSTCLLWEDTFYVDGKIITQQIEEVCKRVEPDQIVWMAEHVFEKGLLRHIPLFLLVQALKRGAPNCKNAIQMICNRPDQMTELLALYWKDGRKPIPNQLKRGLALAFRKFDEYQLAKYNRDKAIKLKDVLFLCHPKPIDEKQEDLWKRLINDELKTPDTWEVRLSSGANKKQSFEELLLEGKMGRLAIIRNLRNMSQAGIDKVFVRYNLLKKSRPILPFQFLAAAKNCPQWEDIIDESMLLSMKDYEPLIGKTLLLVDVSGSMKNALSGKSEMVRMDAACGIAILLKEICKDIDIFSFSEALAHIPPRHGMALRDAIVNSQVHSGTYLGKVLYYLMNNQQALMSSYERIIVITDEQTHDAVPALSIPKQYIINVAPYQNSILNHGQWHVVNGFSENVIEYIRDYEEELV